MGKVLSMRDIKLQDMKKIPGCVNGRDEGTVARKVEGSRLQEINRRANEKYGKGWRGRWLNRGREEEMLAAVARDVPLLSVFST